MVISHVKLERGTVATDWTPAPEDVQSEIDAAKEQATKAQQSTDNLKGYVDGAYKDGIITEVESKAIATYINEVEAMWSSAFGSYERVYTNTLLTGAPKTALGDAKITLAGAKDNLIGQIKSAITDGKATKAEATETERLYNVYKGALRDFQRALKVAEEAIRKGGVDSIQIGGRNLFWKEDFVGDLAQRFELVYDHVQPTAGDNTYTFSFEYRIAKEDKAADRRVSLVNIIWDKDIIADGEWHRKTYTIQLPLDKSKYPIHGWICDYSSPNGRKIEWVGSRNIKLERGTKATDWTPAPSSPEM